MTIPYTAMEVNAQRERYRILRVNVMTVVRMYNKVQPPSAQRCMTRRHASVHCTLGTEVLSPVKPSHRQSWDAVTLCLLEC